MFDADDEFKWGKLNLKCWRILRTSESKFFKNSFRGDNDCSKVLNTNVRNYIIESSTSVKQSCGINVSRYHEFDYSKEKSSIMCTFPYRNFTVINGSFPLNPENYQSTMKTRKLRTKVTKNMWQKYN